MLCAEIIRPFSKSLFVCTWYRPPNSDMSLFNEYDVFLQKCESENKELIVIGDINCDVMKSPPDAHTQQLNFLSSLYQLDQLINKPTRETKKSSTLIDLVLTNMKESISTSGVIHLGMSDHSLVYAVRKFVISKRKPTVREVRDFKRFNAECFLWDLAEMPWHVINQYNNPNECWRVWKSFFNDTLNMHAPFRHKRVKGNSVPWITPEIKCMMRNRDYHKKYAIKHGSQLHWQKFRLLRNKVNIEIRNAKSKYFHDKITDCSVMNDPKKTWKLINSLLGKNAKSNNVNELLIGGISVSDPKSIAEELNDYFISIGSKLAAEYENEPSTNVDYLPANYNIDQYSGTFLKFSPILVDSVASTLRDLKACKATGLDKIPAKILKLLANIIAPSLTFIFNLSLATGTYIDEWKQARVTPIFKSGDRRQCENYRPISILPVVSKVFEKEVFRQLYSYLTEGSLLSKFQSGFRPKHSTVTALIQMCDEWLENMDNGKLNGVVFLDIKKAFDSINHHILLNKMNEQFGIFGMELKWFESYLLNREQQCCINGELSSNKVITCGVPQGSILGPLLFLLYINDLPDCLKSTTPGMYADDTQIFSSSNNANELVVRLNSDLAHVCNWLKENRLQMHPSKCKMMFIGSPYHINNIICEEPVVANGKPIPRINTQVCLGVNLDENLSWASHIEMICKKASSGIGVIKRIKPFVPMHTLEFIYKSLVQPYFDYCSPLWDTCGKLLKDKLQRFQTRAARVISGANYDTHSVDLFNTLSWDTLENRRTGAKSVLMYKILNDHTAPGLRGSFVRREIDQTNYHLRNTATDLSLPKPKREFLKKSFKYSGAMLWNQLPVEGKLAESLQSFKSVVG